MAAADETKRNIVNGGAGGNMEALLCNDETGGAGQERKQEGSPYEFNHLSNSSTNPSAENIDFILDIPLEISVELGRTKMLVDELLKLAQGSVIELSKISGETLDILANQRLIAKGEVVVVNDQYGVRLTEIVSPFERVEKLR